MAKKEETVREKAHIPSLMYGITDGKNLPFMQVGKNFSVGYNSRYGLVDVCEDNGAPFFEGRVNIENLLSKLQSESQRDVESQVKTHIMNSYNNLFDYQNNPQKYSSPPTPILEVLTRS